VVAVLLQAVVAQLQSLQELQQVAQEELAISMLAVLAQLVLDTLSEQVGVEQDIHPQVLTLQETQAATAVRAVAVEAAQITAALQAQAVTA
jgi:hypothetical protein